MSRLVTALCLALALVSPVLAQDGASRAPRSAYVQGTLNVVAGERVTLRQLDSGAFELVKAEVVGPEAALPPANATSADAARLNTAAPGTVVFTLGLRRDVGSFLKVENGLETGFGYVGYIVRYVGGQAHGPNRTSVCTVPPGVAAFEHWNEPVIQAIAGTLKANEDKTPVCKSHSVNE